MAKGCLFTLGGNILTTCDVPAVGVKDIYLVSPGDVHAYFYGL